MVKYGKWLSMVNGWVCAMILSSLLCYLLNLIYKSAIKIPPQQTNAWEISQETDKQQN